MPLPASASPRPLVAGARETGLHRIDPEVLSPEARERLRDPWSLRVDDAFEIYFQIKEAGYGDEFTKTQKRMAKQATAWMRNSKPGLSVARRFWVEALANRRLCDITDHVIAKAIEKLARLPRHHGKTFTSEKGFLGIIEAVDQLEIAQTAEAQRQIDLDPSLSEAQQEELLIAARIPRLRAETFLKHGRAMGRIGRCLEGLGLLSRNPFALCCWTKAEEDSLKAQEETRARTEWDDRLYRLFRTPEFQGETEDPGSPIFWATMIGLHQGCRMQEVLQLAPNDFGSESGIPYLTIRNAEGNSVKSISGERRLPIHPNLLALGLMDLVDLRRREKEPRLFPHLTRSEVRGSHAALFSKTFGYYRKSHDVYWPGLDFHALRTTFHGFLLNSDEITDARRRRLMGHTPLDEGEKSYAQGLSPSTLLRSIEEVKIDISMVVSPIRAARQKVVSLPATRARLASVT